MKHFALILLILFSSIVSFAQTETEEKQYVIVTKNDGTEYVGYIVSDDGREVLLVTEALGNLYLPKHEIKRIDKISYEAALKELQIEKLAIDKLFATRYFLTTNGMATPKGNHYAHMNLLGPEIHFAATDRLSLGLMSTWIGSPWVFAGKYTIASQENFHFGVGALVGTGGYLGGEIGVALPFAAVTFGNNKNNVNFSGGWGGVGEWSEMGENGSGLFSVAACFKAGRKISVILDSFVITGIREMDYDYNPNTDTYDEKIKYSTLALFIGGVRFQTQANKAFQVGFTTITGSAVGDYVIPIPMVGWYRAL